jgi:hypothetical protein
LEQHKLLLLLLLLLLPGLRTTVSLRLHSNRKCYPRLTHCRAFTCHHSASRTCSSRGSWCRLQALVPCAFCGGRRVTDRAG